MSIQTIKAAIKTNLDALVTSMVLGGATELDIKKGPLQADFALSPHAFLMPPAMQSEVLDNRSILRTYSFGIMILYRAENVSTTAALETNIESILSAFDNDPTLGGTALGGVLPVSSSPEPFQHNGRDLIMVELMIEAKEVVQLTFS